MIREIFFYICLASIAGGITSLVFLAAERWVCRHTSAEFTCFLCRFSLLAFIVPYYMVFFWREGKYSIIGSESPTHVILTETGTASKMFYDWSLSIHLNRIISYVWIAGMAVYLIIAVITYTRLLKDIDDNTYISDNGLWNRIFDEIKGYRVVELRFGDYFIQPFTTGVFKKYVVIPEGLTERLSEQEIRLLLLHELSHVSRGDAVFKIFIEMLNCLHWYNPLFYIMKGRLDLWEEMGCDERVEQSFSENGRNTYLDLLLKMFENNVRHRGAYVSFLTSRKNRILMRRLGAIMKRECRESKTAKVVITCLAMCVFIGSSNFAKACDLDLYSVLGERTEAINSEDFENIGDVADEDLLEYYEYKSIDDIEIIDESNDTIDRICSHTYKDTKITKHKKYSDGSCDVIYYNAQECTKCGKVKLLDEDRTVHYKVCPH